MKLLTLATRASAVALCAGLFGAGGALAQGAQGPVTVIYTIIKRKNIQTVVTIIHSLHPRAFL